MKSQIRTLILIGIFGIAPLSYAQSHGEDASIEEVKKETKDLLQVVGSYTSDKKDEAVEAAKKGLDKIDKRIDTLESKVDENWENMSKAMQKEARENLKVLRKQRNKVAEWYGSMKSSSASAWEHTKKGFSKAYQDLQNSWEKSEKEFESKK
jgi:hypothetical protein